VVKDHYGVSPGVIFLLVIYRYHASLFTAPDAPSPVPGCRTPHLRCKDGSSLYDAMGPEFTLPRFDFVVDVAALEAAARHREVSLKILDIERQDAAIFHGGGLVLSCLDQHVAWHGDTLPADRLALIDRIRSAAS
jgi:hypothetical protein